METTGDLRSSLRAETANDLRLYEAGKEKCSPAKDILNDAKDYHLLHFVLSGKGVFVLDGREYHLGKGDMFYIPPHKTAHYYPDKKEPWTYTWFGFDGPRADVFLDVCGISESAPIYAKIRDNSMNDPLHELVYNYNRAGYLDVRCLGYAYIVFATMLDHSLDIAKRTLTPKESHVKEAKEFISNNFQFPISVQEIADSVNLTTNYLSNIFQETLGLSPKQYLTKYRMDKACMMLLDRKAKVKDVAAKVGYKNQLHFSGEFKKSVGLSPKHYQEKKAKRLKGD